MSTISQKIILDFSIADFSSGTNVAPEISTVPVSLKLHNEFNSIFWLGVRYVMQQQKKNIISSEAIAS